MRAVLLACVVACSSNPAASPDAAALPDAQADAAIDAPPPRPLLAAGGVQLLVSGPRFGLQITPADLATDADVVEIHQEFYGVPWDAFLAHTDPPAAWVAIMDDIASQAHATGKPIFLSVSMLNGARKSLAPKTVVDGSGNVSTTDNWAAACYDFGTASDAAANEQAYLDYVKWMVDEFEPQWLNYAIEVNLFAEQCPPQWSSLVDVANATYTAVKAKQPAIVAFPSIQIDHLYGFADGSCADPNNRDACFDANYAQIVPMHRDRFAMSSYPVLIGKMTVADLPADWFTRGAARGGEVPLIAETGTNSTSLTIDDPNAGCFQVLTASETDANAYLARVLGDSATGKLELVNWWSDRDLVDARLMTDCPCTFDATWCAVLDAFRGTDPATQDLGEITLKAFGTMGLRNYDGSPKSLLATWQTAK